jgi:hypothetical protein
MTGAALRLPPCPRLDPRSNLSTKYGRLAEEVSLLTPVLTAKLINDLLFTGPRLITILSEIVSPLRAMLEIRL